jgi:hypothetical protein
MGTFEILFSILISISIGAIALYFFNKQRKALYENALSPNVKKNESAKPTIKDLVFASDMEREKHLLEISKIHETNTIVWFERDEKHLSQFLEKNKIHSSVKVIMHSAPEIGAINPDIPVVLWGRHPLASVEDKALAAMPSVSVLVGMTSLDDALIQHFGGDKIKSLMGKLGHKQGEIIEHSMISASIRNAQEDLDKKIENPISANSASDWFVLNANKIR